MLIELLLFIIAMAASILTVEVCSNGAMRRLIQKHVIPLFRKESVRAGTNNIGETRMLGMPAGKMRVGRRIPPFNRVNVTADGYTGGDNGYYGVIKKVKRWDLPSTHHGIEFRVETVQCRITKVLSPYAIEMGRYDAALVDDKPLEQYLINLAIEDVTLASRYNIPIGGFVVLAGQYNNIIPFAEIDQLVDVDIAVTPVRESIEEEKSSTKPEPSEFKPYPLTRTSLLCNTTGSASVNIRCMRNNIRESNPYGLNVIKLTFCWEEDGSPSMSMAQYSGLPSAVVDRIMAKKNAAKEEEGEEEHTGETPYSVGISHYPREFRSRGLIGVNRSVRGSGYIRGIPEIQPIEPVPVTARNCASLSIPHQGDYDDIWESAKEL